MDKKAIEQRHRVHRMYCDEGVSKTKIARGLCISKAFVVQWTQSCDQDLEQVSTHHFTTHHLKLVRTTEVR